MEAQGIYYGDAKLIDSYIRAATALGVQDKLVVLAELPAYADLVVQIFLEDGKRVELFNLADTLVGAE